MVITCKISYTIRVGVRGEVGLCQKMMRDDKEGLWGRVWEVIKEVHNL